MIKKFALPILSLYVVALHVSMAGMEIFSAILLLISIVALSQRQLEFRTAFDIPVLIYVAIALINILFTENLVPFHQRLSELAWIFIYWSLVKTLMLVWSEKSEQFLLKVWIFGLLLATAFGTYQFFTGLDPIRHSVSHLVPRGDVFRATGFFSLCLTFAYSMGISGLSVSLPSFRLHRTLPFITVTVSAIAIVTSMTRGAWVSFGVTALIPFILSFKHFRKSQIALAGLIFIGLTAIFMSTKGGQESIEKLVNFKTESAFVERTNLWKAYLEMFYDHPVFGVGYHQGSEFVQSYSERLGYERIFVSHAHNDYIQVLAETGIVGFSAFIYLLGFALVKTFSLRKTHPEWAYSLFAGQIYILLGSLTQANFTDAEVNHFLIFNWAIASALIVRSQQKMMAK